MNIGQWMNQWMKPAASPLGKSYSSFHLLGLEWSHMQRRWLLTTCWMKDWKYSHTANILRLDQIPPCFNIPVISHCIENKILAAYQRATSSSISGPLFLSNFTSNFTSLPYWQHSSLPWTCQVVSASGPLHILSLDPHRATSFSASQPCLQCSQQPLLPTFTKGNSSLTTSALTLFFPS